MSQSDVIVLIGAILLVPLAGGLACVDSALARVSVARVDEFARERRRGAKTLALVVADRARYTNLLLLLRMTCELTSTVLVTIVARAQFGPHWPVTVLTIAVMVVATYVLVGVGPRTIGRQHPYRVALVSAGAVHLLGRVFGPLASLLIVLGNAVTPGKGFREGPFSSEVELRELVDMAESRGVVEHDEREMIQSVFELGDTIAREVMVPRTELVYIERTKTVPQALALALRSGFSRIPVTDENIDDIIGVVYLKDLARRAQDADRARITTVDEVMRVPVYVPESKPVDELLREMQAHRTHISIVIDEYGGTAGLVTIEDILEEIVGEIADEYDNERPPIERIDADTARVTARLAVEDLASLFNVDLPDRDDVETVGGLLAESLGTVPIPGSTATIRGLELTAESVGGRRNRIDTVLVRRVETPAAGADDPDSTTPRSGREDRGSREERRRDDDKVSNSSGKGERK
ncbi:CBS domain containing-hemolysin-like protein [Jatrophihabitans sp. GAS493]|uniref:hemolysin family protein n=1 Tax=Jatrophihabitans sp. GAS493 TaxID=1907575 RepID=UPI000BB747D2|nr:hemolysin family protein [Jatrophihabitans sp. GAS493]SOD74706.1 CBS domain containing-hemolysin-like protein [Jatrophihabitans sp. GAS493]